MFKDLTYKKKNMYLLAGVVLFAFLSYKMAFQNTLTAYREVCSLKEQLRMAQDAPKKINALQQQMISIERILGTGQRADTNVQQQLLGIVTDYCQKSNTVLREFPKTIQKTQDDYLVETNIFILEGNFTKLLRLIYLLEQKNRIGKIASVNFLSKKDFKTKLPALTSTIYLQNVKKVSK
jgi:hypothetical protein